MNQNLVHQTRLGLAVICLEGRRIANYATDAKWSQWRDFNSRSLGPKPSALTDYATLRKKMGAGVGIEPTQEAYETPLAT